MLIRKTLFLEKHFLCLYGLNYNKSKQNSIFFLKKIDHLFIDEELNRKDSEGYNLTSQTLSLLSKHHQFESHKL
jgi:hypothetical protein